MQQALARIDRPFWFPDWSGDIAAIVGGGESVSQEAVGKLKGRCRVIVVNNAYQLAPWADVLYAADGKWWQHNREAHSFAGLKVTPDAAIAMSLKLCQVELLGQSDTDADKMQFDMLGLLTRGGNGGFQAINLATQFGAMRQIWLGLDFVGEHWHGKHPTPLSNPRQHTLDKWCKRLDGQASVLASYGVEVVNASERSALTAYPKMSVDAAFERWR